MRQSKLTIGKKIALMGSFLSLMTIVLGVASLVGLTSADNSIASVAEDSLTGILAGNRIQANLFELRGNAWRHIAATDPADKARLEGEINRLKGEVAAGLADLEKGIDTDEERELDLKIRPLVEQYYVAWDSVVGLSRLERDEDAYKKYLADAAPHFDAAKGAVSAVIEYHRSRGTKHSDDAQKQSAQTRTLVLIVLLVSVFGGAAVLFFVVRGINRELIQAVTEVGSGASQVASAASQISSSSQALAQGSSEQAASLEETSSSSEEINSMAQKNTENTRSAAGLVGKLQTAFEDANRSLDGTVAAMQELTGSSEKISRIIKVIDEIAFQTNILALNAAVEAARAGEAGMGFAVVADEVRNLAQRSAQAAKDTASLIEDSIGRSREGKNKVDQVAAAIRAIAEDTNQIRVLVDEVHTASQEQSRGIEQVAKAVTQMENVTQQAAASAEQSAAASTELTAQASSLEEVVERLSEIVGVHAQTAIRQQLLPQAPSPAMSSRQAGRKEFPLHDGESF